MRLVMKLPFDVVVVYRQGFPTVEDAEIAAALLPQGYEVVDDNSPLLSGAIEVPFRVLSGEQTVRVNKERRNATISGHADTAV